MSEPTPEQLLHAKRKLCFRIAELLPMQFPNLRGYDVDKAAKWLYALIPDTAAEADAQMALLSKDDEEPRTMGPSMLSLLRKALQFTEGATIRQTLELATKRCEAYSDLLAIARQYVAMCEDTFYDMEDMSPESKRLYDEAKSAIAKAEST